MTAHERFEDDLRNSGDSWAFEPMFTLAREVRAWSCKGIRGRMLEVSHEFV